MDVEIPGSFQEQNSSMELSTPIKKIKNLVLDSPLGSSPIYPKLDEICSPSRIMDSMIDKGYSQRLTNTVLNELNIRANEISKLTKSPGNVRQEPTESTTGRRNKRYSGIHRSRFNNMESISNHYAAVRHNNSTDTRNSQAFTSYQQVPDTFLRRTEIMTEKQFVENDLGKRDASVDVSSVTKRRKTLNGPEEVLIKSTFTLSTNQTLSSPLKKISPSKKSFNLNKLLNDSGDNENFLKPVAPSKKLRASSLEMAGVKSPTKGISINNKENYVPQLTKKPSIAHLRKQPSIPQLQKKTSIPQLQKKPSIPQLQKKPSVPQLHKKPSTHQLQKKSSIPLLQKKPSIPNIQSKHSMSQLSRRPSISDLQKADNSVKHRNFHTSTLHAMEVDDDSQGKYKHPPKRYLSSHFSSKSNQAVSSFGSSKSISNFNSSSASQKSIKQVPQSTSQKSSNITIPEPFSLYNKPTISSSQKSLNRFQKFKEKFH